MVTFQQFDPLRIYLLGGFRLSIGERTIPPEQFRLRKARSLIKLLALAPQHRLHRDQLIELLWPDSDPETAGEKEQALELAVIASHIQGTEKYWRDEIEEVITGLEIDLPPQVITDARQRGEVRDLTATIDELIAALESGRRIPKNNPKIRSNSTPIELHKRPAVYDLFKNVNGFSFNQRSSR